MPVLADGLRVNTVLDFDLFLRQPDEHYVLYRNKNLAFTSENAERLRKSKAGYICISSKDREAYLNYIEGQLSQIISDSSVPVDRKTTLLYEAAINATHEIFCESPTSAGVERAITIAGNIAALITTSPEAFEWIIKTTPSEYTIETHSINVCAYSLAIANSMATLSAEDMRALAIGALLHDIGKCKIDEDILNKRGELNTREWEELKKHPEYGLKMLEGFAGLPPGALLIVNLHHEKVDGSGYPAALKGKDIPLPARITCVADIFDAITSDRAYKGAIGSYEALIEMADEMQAAIDGEVFAYFIKLLQL